MRLIQCEPATHECLKSVHGETSAVVQARLYTRAGACSVQNLCMECCDQLKFELAGSDDPWPRLEVDFLDDIAPSRHTV